MAATASAQPPCPVGAPLGAVVFALPGTLTIVPSGGIETLAGIGSVITVCITCGGVPLVGLPAAAVTVNAPGLVFCPGSNIADAPTDAAGCTTFSGALCGGGCAPMLDVFAAGTLLGAAPVAINSPDTGIGSPLFVDASDLAAFAFRLGLPAMYSPCFDYNESGPPVINAADLAYFAANLGRSCTGSCP
jgi:hypothetical protein